MDVLNVDTWTAITAIPADTATIVDLIQVIAMAMKNLVLSTADTTTIHNSAGTSIGDSGAGDSDNGTTFTRARLT